MTLYRLQPDRDRRWWLALFGITAAILLLPAMLLPVVPAREVSERVVLGGENWEVPLDMECRPATDVLLSGWSCGDLQVQTILVEGGEDPDRTLRRMMRAMLMFPPPQDAEILKEGDARMLIDDATRSVGLSLEGTGEREGLTIVTVLTGPGTAISPVADDVWHEYAGRGLPEIVRSAIEAPPRGTDEGFRLPFEPEVLTA
ncbi:MAG: hypothetical protein Q4G50_00175 [Corynebacterium sp.]|uniref:hypothetical protein n=1 Tax=Corynebacterium sp. TaxID=1720 RepID=UPI0026DFF395|nr:hypothetical protein [Corynebacterium sp.]MDO5668404.1 hypothetical protein [Corynebacterium sp.]